MPLAGQASSAAFDGNVTERFLGETERRRVAATMHAAFHDRSNSRTYISPKIYHHQGSREGDTNSRAVLVRRKLYRII